MDMCVIFPPDLVVLWHQIKGAPPLTLITSRIEKNKYKETYITYEQRYSCAGR